jgi:hypothetical protein
MILGLALSSDDSSVVLKLCSLNLTATKLAYLELHKIIFGVSKILLITCSQGLLNPLLTNKLVKKCSKFCFFKLAHSLKKSMACVKIGQW